MGAIIRKGSEILVMGLSLSVALSLAEPAEIADEGFNYAAIAQRYEAVNLDSISVEEAKMQGECLVGLKALNFQKREDFDPVSEWTSLRSFSLLEQFRPCTVLIIMEVARVELMELEAGKAANAGRDEHLQRGESSMNGLKTRIETSMFQESVAFYTRHLEMTVLQSWDKPGDKGAILGLGASVRNQAFLEIAYTDTAKTYEGISLQFRVPDLDAVVARVRGRLDFEGPTERPWGSKYLYLEDPAGIQVIVYEGEL